MKCLLDIDGVLADFVGGAGKLLGKDPALVDCWDFYHRWDTDCHSFWNAVGHAGENFWASLEPTKDGYKILAAVEQQFGQENVCLLTSPSLHQSSTSGKVRWINEHLPEYRRRYLIGAAKQFLAHPNSVLVDDYCENISAFQANGGHAVLVPRPWNQLHSVTDSAAHVVTALQQFKRAA